MLYDTLALETALQLFVGSCIALLTGCLLANCAWTAKGKSLVWKTVTLTMVFLIVLALTGFGQGLHLASRQLIRQAVNSLTRHGDAEPPMRVTSKFGKLNSPIRSSRRSHVRGVDAGIMVSPAMAAKRESFESPLEPTGDDRPVPNPGGLSTSSVPGPFSDVHLQPEYSVDQRSSNEQARSHAVEPVQWWLVVWLVGTLFCLCRAAMSWWYAFRLRAGLTDVSPRTQQRLDSLRKRMGIHRRVTVFCHPSIAAPVVVGTIHSTVLVPLDFATEFSPAQQDSIFAHELTHLAANDNFWLATNLFATALLWWCPAMWYARLRLRSAMEMAADEASLHLLDGPQHLAESLMKVGRLLTARQGYSALGMAGRGTHSSLATRVHRLLSLSAISPAAVRSRTVVRVAVVFLFLFNLIAPGVVVRAEQPTNGESGMHLLKQSWRRSILAGFVGAFLLPGAATAQDVEVEFEYRDDDREHERREIRVERYGPNDERENREVTIIRRRRDGTDPDAAEITIRREMAKRQQEVDREIERLTDRLRAAEGEQRGQLARRLREMQAIAADTRAETQQRLEKLAEPETRQRREWPQNQDRREHHIRVAIENLMAAGLGDVAERLERQLHEEARRRDSYAHARDFQERRDVRTTPRLDPRSASGMAHIRREMDEMRAQMREMREMMHELMRRSERDTNEFVRERHEQRDHLSEDIRHDHDEEHHDEEHHDDDDHERHESDHHDDDDR